jgi:hypothetical protein
MNRCVIDEDVPRWLIDSLMQAVARLPRLTELQVETDGDYHPRIPFGLFANLSKLTVECDDTDVPFFTSQVATAIANSPQLRSLRVSYLYSPSNDGPPPALSGLFAKLSTQNPLCIEHLYINDINATMDQVTLPHLMHLTSFHFQDRTLDHSVAQSVWTSFLANNIKLSHVKTNVGMTEEMLLYLSSWSGLKKFDLDDTEEAEVENLSDRLFEEVIPKHINSLQSLRIVCRRWVKPPILSVLLSR